MVLNRMAVCKMFSNTLLKFGYLVVEYSVYRPRPTALGIRNLKNSHIVYMGLS